MGHANHDWPKIHGHCVPCLIEKLDAVNLQIEELKKSKCPNAGNRDLAGICTVGPMYCQGCVESANRVADGMISHRDEKLTESNRLIRDYRNVIDLTLTDLIVAQELGDGSNRVASAIRMLKETQEYEKRNDKPKRKCACNWIPHLYDCPDKGKY